MNGIINIYKEKGYTSFDVVAKMRGIFHQKKIGHTGTLDPDAEGVLPVCLGNATKVCDLLTDKGKEYEAVLLLGKTTDTQDISGEILYESEVRCKENQIREAVASFIGCYEQTPPMYSAIKMNGQKLCDLARKGITVERKARTVYIEDIVILSIHIPEIHIRVTCSKGTYIRTLCQDIGDVLRCGGCMKSLIRTRSGDFRVEDAVRLDEIPKKPISEILLPVDILFAEYPKVSAAESAEKYLINGNRIPQRDVREYGKENIMEYRKQDVRENHLEAVRENCLEAVRENRLEAVGENCRADVREESKVKEGQTVRLYDWKGRFAGIYVYKEETQDYKPVKLFM